jgi:hypothetical protein
MDAAAKGSMYQRELYQREFVIFGKKPMHKE